MKQNVHCPVNSPASGGVFRCALALHHEGEHRLEFLSYARSPKNLLANVDHLLTEWGRSVNMLRQIRAELAEQEQKKAQ